MWVNFQGDNISSVNVCFKINKATGLSYTVELLESTFKIGQVYQNGGIWFQRLS